MDQSTLLVIMASAVVISAIALVVQAFMLIGMYKTTTMLRDRLLTTLPQLEALMATSKTAIEEARAAVADIRVKSNHILDAGHRQMRQLETLLTDATERTTKQLAFAEAVVEDTLGRVESTVGLVHQNVLKPIRSITGIAAGVGAAVNYLFSRRPNPENATLDEEMFI
jgi:hypothetical protein